MYMLAVYLPGNVAHPESTTSTTHNTRVPYYKSLPATVAGVPDRHMITYKKI
jgi:hypothetical protein